MGMFGQRGSSMPFDRANPSVTQELESTTATTFALLHSVVQTFAGLAQMLESTFMATHASFFALVGVGVVDQFAQLRIHGLRRSLQGGQSRRGKTGTNIRGFDPQRWILVDLEAFKVEQG